MKKIIFALLFSTLVISCGEKEKIGLDIGPIMEDETIEKNVDSLQENIGEETPEKSLGTSKKIWEDKYETKQESPVKQIDTKFKVIVDKAYFYDSADTPDSNSSYLVLGDYIEISPAKSGETKYFVSFANDSGVVTTGYIRKSDLRAVTQTEIENEQVQDERNKEFILEHYADIANAHYYTAYNNYLYPKAKTLSVFTSWYEDTEDISVTDIKKIGENTYEYFVTVYSPGEFTKYKTSMELIVVDESLKILDYSSKKID